MNKCEPCKPKEFSGREDEFGQIKEFVENYKKGAMLVYGQTGCGKTSFAHALAKELGHEILEVNASDIRNKDALLKIVKSAAMQMSLFATSKIILIDEVDALSSKDRGAVSAIIEIIKDSKWPIILTANDEMNDKVHDLKKKCRFIELPAPTHNEMCSILQDACCKNNICYDDSVLRNIARQCDGDVRASMIDLFVASSLGDVKDASMLASRLRNRDIDESLRIIFNTIKPDVALNAFDNTDMDLKDCLMWIEENMAKEYSGLELNNGYDALSKADVFYGRIRRWQHWRFLVYVNAMLTAGVALSKEDNHAKSGSVRYVRNSRPLKYWIMNNKNKKKKAIAEKLAARCHTSKRKAFKYLMPYFKVQFGNNAEGIAKELSLADDEADYIQS